MIGPAPSSEKSREPPLKGYNKNHLQVDKIAFIRRIFRDRSLHTEDRKKISLNKYVFNFNHLLFRYTNINFVEKNGFYPAFAVNFERCSKHTIREKFDIGNVKISCMRVVLFTTKLINFYFIIPINLTVQF